MADLTEAPRRGTPAGRRIQLRRTKGWRKPAGAVVVSRPSRFGNPFTVADALREGADPAGARRHCTEQFRGWLAGTPGLAGVETERRAWILTHLPELAGRDLCCWCPLPAPGAPDHCHAAVLLALTDPGTT